MPSNLRRGILAERQLAIRLRRQGYLVARSAASKGPYDLLAIGRKDILLISVKSAKRMTDGVRRQALIALRQGIAPMSSVVKKQLWCWQPRRGWSVQW